MHDPPPPSPKNERKRKKKLQMTIYFAYSGLFGLKASLNKPLFTLNHFKSQKYFLLSDKKAFCHINQFGIFYPTLINI